MGRHNPDQLTLDQMLARVQEVAKELLDKATIEERQNIILVTPNAPISLEMGFVIKWITFPKVAGSQYATVIFTNHDQVIELRVDLQSGKFMEEDLAESDLVNKDSNKHFVYAGLMIGMWSKILKKRAWRNKPSRNK